MMSSAMRQLEERHMASKIELMVWSNKMDLLALSNAKGEVTLHRLIWQRVWTLGPPSEDVVVRGIAWRPDGQVIAIGYSNNLVLLVDVENKDILHKFDYNESIESSSSISCMRWLEEKDSNTCYSSFTQDKSSYLLPKLPPISRTFGSINEDSTEVLEDTKKVSCQRELNFLIICLTNGQLFLSVFGLFQCGVVTLPDDMKDNVTIIEAEMTSDLKYIFLLVSNETDLKLVIFNSHVLNTYCKEMYALSYKHGQIMNLMDYLENTMHAIQEAYENMLLLDMESKLSKYAESKLEGAVSADFLELLMFGVASEQLESFLLHDLSDKGIKKLGHSIELSHSNIQKLILKHLLEVGKNIAFHLSELKGMARFTDRFQVLGVDELIVAKSFTEVGSFLVKANEVLSVIDESMKKYRALFKWLYEMAVRISDDRGPDHTLTSPGISEQEIKFIADYLYNLEGTNTKTKKKNCFLDHFEQYLSDEDLMEPISPENNVWEKFLMENPCIASNPAIITRYDKLSLIQQHNRLKNILKEAFINPQKAIGPKITLSSVIHLSTVTCVPKVSMTHVTEKDKLLLAFIPHQSTTSFVYMDIYIQEGTMNKCLIYFKNRDVSLGFTTMDLQIYNKDIISVLLQPPEESRHSMFVQMPMRKMEESVGVSEGAVDGASLVEPGAIRTIENMLACKLAVSGLRRVAVFLSEKMHKVRTYEMEVEEDEEEEDMETTRESDTSSLHLSI